MRRLLLAVALVACEPAQPAATPAPAGSASAPAAPVFVGPGGSFRSERFALRLGLPDGAAWRIDDHGSPWLTAAHPATSSKLAARTWAEEGRVGRARCEEVARLRRPLPERAGAELLQDRAIDAPPGFDTHLTVGVIPSHPGAPIAGFALAFGVRGHRCFAWAYTTTAEGPGAERVLGERLAAMVEGSLAKARVETDLGPQVPREPFAPPGAQR